MPYNTPGKNWTPEQDVAAAENVLAGNPEINHDVLKKICTRIAGDPAGEGLLERVTHLLRAIKMPYNPPRRPFVEWMPTFENVTVFASPPRPDCFNRRISDWTDAEREEALDYMNSDTNVALFIATLLTRVVLRTTLFPHLSNPDKRLLINNATMRMLDFACHKQPLPAMAPPFTPDTKAFESWLIRSVASILVRSA